MKLSKWLLTFVISILLGCTFFVGMNVLVDPFGLFGDPVFGWWSYDMTQNPRLAKIEYLDRNYEKYNGYIIGSSKTSSFPTQPLNELYDASFYNLMMYGEDLYDVEKTLDYVLENYEVDHIVINSGFEALYEFDNESDSIKGNLHVKTEGGNPLKFYSKYLFLNPEYAMDKLQAYRKDGYMMNGNRVFIEETGAYDKSTRDIETISDLTNYLQDNPDFIYEQPYRPELPDLNLCLESVAKMKAACQARGVSFTFFISPLFHTDLDSYMGEDFDAFYYELAQITDFWDFSGYHSVAYEPRYFYDLYHHRNTVGEMALAVIAGDTRGLFVPEDFGFYVTKDNVAQRLETYRVPAGRDTSIETQVPVLMYHDLGNDVTGATVVTPETFRDQLMALQAEGYETVTFSDLTAYTTTGVPLPEKPIVITFDDGYRSNITLAAPILEELGMCATVNVIGISDGVETYKDTGVAITPHFYLEEVKKWVDRGVLDIQSHSYDMHQVEELDGADCRSGALQMQGESEEEYIASFQADFLKSREQIESAVDTSVFLYAYPYGFHDELTELLLSEMGVEVTLTVEEGVNTIVKGLPQTLRAMRRINVTEDMAGNILVTKLKGWMEI